jgi:hypothetical protein
VAACFQLSTSPLRQPAEADAMRTILEESANRVAVVCDAAHSYRSPRQSLAPLRERRAGRPTGSASPSSGRDHGSTARDRFLWRCSKLDDRCGGGLLMREHRYRPVFSRPQSRGFLRAQAVGGRFFSRLMSARAQLSGANLGATLSPRQQSARCRTKTGHRQLAGASTGYVKAFGCRPSARTDRSRRAGIRKPSQEVS